MSSQDYDQLEKLFQGSWKVDREENFDAFMDAAGMPEDMKKMIKAEKMYTFTRDGNSFKEKTDFGPGMTFEATLKLNEVIDFKDKPENPSVHMKTTPTFKDGVLTEDIQPQLANGGKKHIAKIYLAGDELVVELCFPDGQGVVGKRHYKKC